MSQRLFHYNWLMCSILALQGALAWYLYDFHFRPELRFRDGIKDIGVVSRGEVLDLECVLENNSSNTVQVIGANERCGIAGCFSVPDIPATVDAHSTTRLTIRLKAGMPGQFFERLVFYTTSLEQPTVVAQFRGEVRTDQPTTGDLSSP